VVTFDIPTDADPELKMKYINYRLHSGEKEWAEEFQELLVDADMDEEAIEGGYISFGHTHT